jgi:hypothetical protein
MRLGCREISRVGEDRAEVDSLDEEAAEAVEHADKKRLVRRRS